MKMDFWENVKVSVRANIFENGRCQSRTVLFPDGTKKTLGVYLPGEFEFDSSCRERVLMTSGEVEILFPGDRAWSLVREGETYDVPPGVSFKVRCAGVSEYICEFLP